MSLTQLNCPACGAPAAASGGTCTYCGATLQAAASPGSADTSAPGVRGGGAPGGVTVILHGIGQAHVPVLVEVLRRPAERMAEVPHRTPPTVFHVQPEDVARLRERLGPLGVEVEVGGPDAPQGPGRMGRPGGFGGRGGPGGGRGGPGGPGGRPGRRW